MFPRPQRYYFGFGQRIPTEHLRGRAADKEAVWGLREDVANAVKVQIDKLIEYRKQDRLSNWSRMRRWLAPLQKQ